MAMSNSSQNPRCLPGFYFDEEKNRYFPLKYRRLDSVEKEKKKKEMIFKLEKSKIYTFWEYQAFGKDICPHPFFSLFPSSFITYSAISSEYIFCCNHGHTYYTSRQVTIFKEDGTSRRLLDFHSQPLLIDVQLSCDGRRCEAFLHTQISECSKRLVRHSLVPLNVRPHTVNVTKSLTCFYGLNLFGQEDGRIIYWPYPRILQTISKLKIKSAVMCVREEPTHLIAGFRNGKFYLVPKNNYHSLIGPFEMEKSPICQMQLLSDQKTLIIAYKNDIVSVFDVDLKCRLYSFGPRFADENHSSSPKFQIIMDDQCILLFLNRRKVLATYSFSDPLTPLWWKSSEDIFDFCWHSGKILCTKK